ncbi:MAG: hypothetical protein J0I41_13645 [Filimonas sp.]|nr:hypothetical protein [Filimonas sp.]
MKRYLIAAVLSLVIVSAFANDNSKIGIFVVNNFKSDFPGAAGVQWTIKNEFAKADFTFDGKKTQAFYTAGGELFATGQNVTLKDIPAKAANKIQKDYADYVVGEVVAYEQVEQPIKYYVSVEDAQKKIILEVSELGSVSVFKKSDK